jgi:hypothetical protein
MNAGERGLKKGRSAICMLLLFRGLLGASETWTRWGSIEVSGTDFAFRVREAGREWTIDPSPLLPKDCEQMCEYKYSHIIAWDEYYRRIYFAIAIGPSWDKPWGIYNYSLATHRFTRFADTNAASFQFGAISDSGRYLAYLKMHHQSAAGPCRSQTDIEIVDLWDRRIGNPALQIDGAAECAIVGSLSWSRFGLEYAGSTHRSNGAQIPEGLFSGRIDVGSVLFH